MATYPLIATPSDDLYSGYVPAGHRSYFFDVRRPSPNQVQLEFSELICHDKVWTKQKIVVPSENLRDVYQGMCEAIKALRKAAQEFGIELDGQSASPQSAAKGHVTPKSESSVKSVATPKHRGTGRVASTVR